jgi:hypothetical protein
VYSFGPFNIRRSVEGKVFWHDHWEMPLSLYLDVETVLNGRQVRPEDVVTLLGPDASGNRTVNLVLGRDVQAIILHDCKPDRQYFRLAQIEVCDRRFYERYKAWIDSLALQANSAELHAELRRRFNEGMELPSWFRLQPAPGTNSQKQI